MVLSALTAAGIAGYVVLARAVRLDEPWIVVRAFIRTPRRLRGRPR
jgi:hypothetical protein